MSGSNVDLLIVNTAEEAAAEAAARLAAMATAGTQIALAGGSTPRRAYELAVNRQPDWSRAGVWFGDERCVPPDDDRSNYRMAREALLDRVTVPPTVHRVQGELDPEAAAAAYEEELDGQALDFVLLGLGSDGHTASLFPNSPALDEQDRWVVAAEPGLDPFVPRVTLTLPALSRARVIVFLADGLSKANAVARAFAGEPSPSTPSSLVRSAAGETIAILDREAAAHLP